ncbi:MAG: hypothetical protein IPN59_11375 [Holophaga sp.]|nr:hypothetical protein [Holophaga sp.]
MPAKAKQGVVPQPRREGCSDVIELSGGFEPSEFNHAIAADTGWDDHGSFLGEVPSFKNFLFEILPFIKLKGLAIGVHRSAIEIVAIRRKGFQFEGFAASFA